MDLHELPDHPFHRHPWEIARARFFCRVLSRQGATQLPLRVLDIGAGDGFFARELLAAMPAGSEVVCYDPNYTEAQLRDSKVAQQRVSFVRQRPAGKFDLILLLDVIEHVPDDRDLLAHAVADFLVDEGRVLVSVPAWTWLYTRHDLFLGHHRRYRPSTLRAVVVASGLQVVLGGGLFHSLLLIRAAEKLAELRRRVRSRPDPGAFGGDVAGVGQWDKGASITQAIGALLALDNRISFTSAGLGLNLPGLSTWTLCRKAMRGCVGTGQE